MSRAVPYTGPFEINSTDDLTITAAAMGGYNFDMWDNGSTQRVMNITDSTRDATYTAEFSAQKIYSISADVGSLGGSISPSGTVYLPDGASQTFTFTPDSGYRVSDVVIDGVSVSAGTNSYTFSGVTGDHTIQVSFALQIMHYIFAMPDDNTTISPDGMLMVAEGTDQTFYFTANDGYAVSMVFVDGVMLSPSEVALGYYTFLDISGDHLIQVFGGAQ